MNDALFEERHLELMSYRDGRVGLIRMTARVHGVPRKKRSERAD